MYKEEVTPVVFLSFFQLIKNRLVINYYRVKTFIRFIELIKMVIVIQIKYSCQLQTRAGLLAVIPLRSNMFLRDPRHLETNVGLRSDLNV